MPLTTTMPSGSHDAAYLLALRCPCGREVTGADAHALVDAARQHLAQVHPDLIGRYDEDDVLALSYTRPV